MQKEKTALDNDTENTTIKPALRLMPGDKDTNNWLSNLSEGSVFLAKPKSTNPQAPSWVLTEFHVATSVVDDIGMCRAVKLVTNIDTAPTAIWVDPQGFSMTNILVKVLIHGEGYSE